MKNKKSIENKILSTSWKDLIEANNSLTKHSIAVKDCDLVVYHKEGNRTENRQHIIFYHGACGRSQMWYNQYETFPEYDLYFVNVRGQGESPMKKGLPDLQGAIDDVTDIMQYFKLNKVTLVGHSWGGNPLQEFTLQNPKKVNGLVIISSWGQHRVMSNKEKKLLKYSSVMYKTIPWSFVASTNSKACSDNSETVALVKKSILETGRDVFVNLGLSGFSQVHSIEGYEGNPPMLLIRGANDFPKPLSKIYAYLLSKNVNAREVVIADTKHQPMNDKPEEFNQILNNFFHRIDKNLH